jgi:predicted nucleic acid-binding protein
MAYYYLDTCIWRDYIENRSDRFRPLGDWALRFIKNAVAAESIIVYSDLIVEELSIRFDDEMIRRMLNVVPTALLLKITITQKDLQLAASLARTHRIPVNDALHAVLAKRSSATLITRDKHFTDLHLQVNKPEELI